MDYKIVVEEYCLRDIAGRDNAGRDTGGYTATLSCSGIDMWKNTGANLQEVAEFMVKSIRVPASRPKPHDDHRFDGNDLAHTVITTIDKPRICRQIQHQPASISALEEFARHFFQHVG